ncbi:MAG: KUP/HAK/KT family potassium transporter [Rickettsiales endosymbiont of Dermacentor nuttalli]
MVKKHIGILTLGITILVVTRAEALYADIGHFGKMPIKVAWYFLVFPLLVLNYLGQAALLIENLKAIANLFINS